MFGISTLKSVFMQTFETGLEPYGFKRLKGTEFLGKLINDEILLYITYEKCGSILPGKKAFRIKVGAQTIYSYDLSEHQLLFASRELFFLAYDKPSLELGMFYLYDKTTLNDAVDDSLNDTISVAIPELSKICDLKTYVDFCSGLNSSDFYNADQLYRDSVVLILSDNHDDFSNVKATLEKSMLRAYNGDSSNPYYQTALRDGIKKIDEELIASRNKVYSNPDLMEKVKAEANSRKEKNLMILKSYGF